MKNLTFLLSSFNPLSKTDQNPNKMHNFVFGLNLVLLYVRYALRNRFLLNAPK